MSDTTKTKDILGRYDYSSNSFYTLTSIEALDAVFSAIRYIERLEKIDRVVNESDMTDDKKLQAIKLILEGGGKKSDKEREMGEVS